MKYMISECGANIAVALLDSNTAQEDINLAHNLFNTHVGNNLYHGVLSFSSQKKFYRFLINKYMLRSWDTNKSFSMLLKEAANKTRSVINNETEFVNFMNEIYEYNNANKVLYKWHHPKYTHDNTEH